jgi:hypothetical protein
MDEPARIVPVFLRVAHAAQLCDMSEGAFRMWLERHGRKIPGLVRRVGARSLRISYDELRKAMRPECAGPSDD